MKNYILFLVLILLCSNIYSQWEPDRKLSTGEVNAQTNENMGQCIAVNGNVVHVVWIDIGNNGNGIYYKRSTDAGVSWGPDTRLTGIPSISDYCSIAVAGNNVHVAYRDSIPGSRTSNYIRSTDGGNTWGSPISLGSYYWWPSIAASDSIVFVALNSNSSDNSEVWCRRSTNNGTSWGPASQISNASGRSEDPSIAAGGGYVHLAWNDNRTDTMQTFYRRSTDLGITWGLEIQRTNSSAFAYCPVLSVSASDVDLVWGDRRNGDFDIYHLHSSDYGSNWGSEERLSSDALSSIYPNIVRSDSNVHVVWCGSGIFYLHSRDCGTTWDSTVKLVSSSSQPFTAFIAVTGTVVHVIWTDSRDGHKAIYYKRNPTGNPGSGITNTITTSSVSSQFCAGTNFSLPYQITGIFLPDNIFTAQLSDTAGSFINPTEIGSINSVGSGTISAQIPKNSGAGTGYRIRVVSSNPGISGTDNGNDITIDTLPTPIINGPISALNNADVHYSVSNNPGSVYKWIVEGGTFIGSDNLSEVDIHWGELSSGKLKVIETNSNECTDSSEVTVALHVNSVQEETIHYNLLLKIIPNPVNGKAKIEITAVETVNANIQIINSYGSEINNFGNILLHEGTQNIDWDCNDMNGESIPSGIYFIMLSSKYGVVALKTVVVK
ncbi:MAG: hypothetical protein A2X61_12805 [Ignavibacteria bacterium GWB2_35_12]|nr:MAG: hypothetical protein A2X63_03830 [Ignavibacteria bacterium GWA2_35_8]OGU41505.1 MAG: hypothetical protein A2X61_12805 [Ignavibacteria bacterium GWB2_35_12]OGU92992.1 MAG: hypothetical protein A2220_15730 [Ignavibacteria bacterium RIFOXYA2_FULL_35_10]OGV22979.1 MAG: hypothetical protein A2475_10275 [Ignavibacteria bacterium RIFOXYC2_FULL_35_21]